MDSQKMWDFFEMNKTKLYLEALEKEKKELIRREEQKGKKNVINTV